MIFRVKLMIIAAPSGIWEIGVCTTCMHKWLHNFCESVCKSMGFVVRFHGIEYVEGGVSFGSSQVKICGISHVSQLLCRIQFDDLPIMRRQSGRWTRIMSAIHVLHWTNTWIYITQSIDINRKLCNLKLFQSTCMKNSIDILLHSLSL